MTNYQSIKSTDVFTPTKPARATFVERESVVDKLTLSLLTPGKQIIVYGHSGSGKTTLLVNKLQQLKKKQVTTRCISSMKFDELVLDAFDQLGAFYDSEISETTGSQISASVTAEYVFIKGLVGSQLSGTSGVKAQRYIPPQLTPQALGKLLGEAECCWVLEDFHKIDEKEKIKLTQVMKVFMDLSDQYEDLKIIAIGAVNTAREVIAYNPEMRNRVSEIQIPLMTHSELKEIISKGEKLLNFHISAKIKVGIIHYSNGLGSVCHQLCLNICFSAKINTTLQETITVNDEQLSKAIEMYMENASDTLKSAFDKAFRQIKKRKYDNGKLILGALAALPQDGAEFAAILSEIKKSEASYPSGNLTLYLNELQKDSRGAIIRYDPSSGKYSFSDPVYLVYAMSLFKPGASLSMNIVVEELSKELFSLLFKTVVRH